VPLEDPNHLKEGKRPTKDLLLVNHSKRPTKGKRPAGDLLLVSHTTV
jgi:hypothetical protein